MGKVLADGFSCTQTGLLSNVLIMNFEVDRPLFSCLVGLVLFMELKVSSRNGITCTIKWNGIIWLTLLIYNIFPGLVQIMDLSSPDKKG